MCGAVLETYSGRERRGKKKKKERKKKRMLFMSRGWVRENGLLSFTSLSTPCLHFILILLYLFIYLFKYFRFLIHFLLFLLELVEKNAQTFSTSLLVMVFKKKNKERKKRGEFP